MSFSGTDKLYNLDKMISECVHRPIIKSDANKFPLYARTDGKFDDRQDSTRSEAWKVACETKYNSPNNIRKIFITFKGVYVVMYQSIAGSDTDLVKFYGYDSIEPEFNAMALREKAFGMGMFVTKDNCTGLKWLTNQWSCSNLEEIYFDWVVGLTPMGYKLVSSLGDKTTTTGLSMQKIILSYFIQASGLLDVQKMKSIFPRLKVVGYISTLYDLCSVMYKSGNQKVGRKSIEDLKTPWYKEQIVTRYLKSGPRQAFGYCFSNVNWASPNSFRTRAYYKYDCEFLEGYFKKLVERYREAELKSTLNIEDTAETTTVKKSEFEKNLDKIYETFGRKKTKATLQAMLGNAAKSDIETTMSQMSEAGQKKYWELLKSKD